MKKLALIIGLISACGIDDEVRCVQNSSGTTNFNCVILKKDEIIGTSECHYHYCSISLR